MATVEVLEVRPNPSADAHIRGFSLESPQPGGTYDVWALTLEGWYLPRYESPTLYLVILGLGREQLKLNVPRPDVVRAHPDLSSSEMIGFRVALNAFRMPAEFELHIVAHHPGRPAMTLGTVRGRRKQLPSIERPRFQPIMLTSFGRTGGTWVTSLIGKHPEIVSLRPFRYESRIATYWVDVFAALSEPRSYRQCLRADAGGKYWWLGEGNLGPAVTDAAGPDFTRWLGKENVEELLVFCQGRIEQAYERVATLEDRPHARFFVERTWPNPGTHSMMWSVYPGAREIVLVRDFRDMVASILAFNERWGLPYFGRHEWPSDEDYVRSLRYPIRQIVDFWKQAPDRTFLLRYEDLIRDPQNVLESVLGYLGVESRADVIEDMLRTDSAHSSRERQLHQTSASAEESIGRWQRDLSDSVQEACQDAFGELLAELGYGTEVGEMGSRV